MKPTGLLLLHLDQFKVHQVSHAHKVRPTKQLRGKDEETGAWNTSAAKEYPVLLSATLARTMVDDACRHPVQQKNVPHAAFFHFLEKYQPVVDPNVEDWEDFGADFVDEAMLPVYRFHLRWQGTPHLSFIDLPLLAHYGYTTVTPQYDTCSKFPPGRNSLFF